MRTTVTKTLGLFLTSFILLNALPALANGNVLNTKLQQLSPELWEELHEAKDKWVYLDFWASWCVPCRRSFPFMNRLHRQYNDLRVIAINVDEFPEDAKGFLEQYPAEFRIIFDHKRVLPGVFNVKGMPTSLVIAPGGEVKAVHQGFNADGAAKISAFFKDVFNP